MTNPFLGNLFSKAIGGRGISLAAPSSLGVFHAARNLAITEEDQQGAEDIAEIAEDSLELTNGETVASNVDVANNSPVEYPIQSEWARRELDDFRHQGRFRRESWAMIGRQEQPNNDGNDDVLVPSPFALSGDPPVLTSITSIHPQEVEPPHWILPQ